MNERDIFISALQKDDVRERQAFLDEGCAGDEALRARIQGLLRAYENAGSFLERPPAEPDFLPQTGPSLPDRAVGQASVEKVGHVIGPYKLLQNLGEGGMGTVWVAEQTEPVQRHVALKVIKPGMDSTQIIARFEQERQALAVMDHPNIANVLDGGQTSGGRPYFVMELVKGVPITTYCDQEQLTPKERLELFIPVCQAVQHAHQKGIVHRDLKPSNVMIALYDGRPVPKVIDFGVAKATGQRLTQRTLFTEVGSIVGTLEYMAPEQAELNNLDIDTRADIYSLGVMLYELLAGSPPFTSKQLRGAAFTEMLRMIKEVEPPKPSTKLSSSEELPSIAAKRKLEPKRLTKMVSGELDWIVMKCLEKERGRRYETANGLALELQRFLDDEPVAAGPPSATYRIRKFVRRNKGAVFATSLVILALLGGMVGAAWGLVAARAAADNERNAKESALKRLGQIERGNGILRSIFEDLNPAPSDKQGGEPLRAILAGRLSKAADQLDAEAVGDPLMVAQLQNALGKSLSELGNADKGIPLLAKARATCEEVLGLEHRDTLNATYDLAEAYREAGRRAEALKLFEQTLVLRKKLLGAAHADTLASMTSLATHHLEAGRPAEAFPLAEEALKHARETLGRTHPETLRFVNNLAAVYLETGRTADALPLFEETVELAKEILGPGHADTFSFMGNLASVYQRAGRHDDAVRLDEETLRLRREHLGLTHPATLFSMSNTAMTYSRAGKQTEALSLFEETLTLRKKYLGAAHPDTLWTMNNLAAAYRIAGQLPKAVSLQEETLALMREVHEPAHPQRLACTNNMIRAYLAVHQTDKAISLLREFAPAQRRQLGPEHLGIVNIFLPIAEGLLTEKRYADAEPLVRECLDIREKKEPDAWMTYRTKSLLGWSLLGQEKHSEAEPFLILGYEGMEQRKAKIPEKIRHDRLTEAIERLVQLYDSWGKSEKAAEWRAKLPVKKPEGEARPPKPD